MKIQEKKPKEMQRFTFWKINITWLKWRPVKNENNNLVTGSKVAVKAKNLISGLLQINLS